ncbi:MAG: hypothetical protein QW292_07065 [Candidatus Parvarchaeota archaeon]
MRGKGQLSIDFLVGVSILVIIVSVLVVFFLPFTHPNYTQLSIDNVCSYISSSISYLSATPSNSSFIQLPLLESYQIGSLDINITGEETIVRSGGYSTACSSDAPLTANESFYTSNLWIYRLSGGGTYVAYFYQEGSGVTGVFAGGGFYPSASIYMTYPNGTVAEIASALSSPFTYNASATVSKLRPGDYSFYAEDTSYPQVKVSFPIEIT